MSHGFEFEPSVAAVTLMPKNSALAVLSLLLNWVNQIVLALSMLALVLTSCVLTYSVVTRYFLKVATDWQD